MDQSLWDHPEYGDANVARRTVAGGAHFPWVEEPEAVRGAFRELADRVA